ncbi:MAG: putative DNA binding domain-containing protein [Deltaproteobacteria bacterium]|nr:putative DNA binding domain-containing protein [Deltaproteobacteria bacterium]
MPIKDNLKIIAAEGEGQKIEFKSKISNLANEMVAFANASGGSIYLGITDDGKIVGVADSNRLRSQIQDMANNCDPRVSIRIISQRPVIEIMVPEGTDKPYRSNDGFFLRIGPNSQQLTRDEIFRFAIKSNKVRFDEQFESPVKTEEEIDQNKIKDFLKRKGIPDKTKTNDILINLGLAQKQQNRTLLTRAALLFFGKNPQKYYPEAYITSALYGDETRAKVLDRLDIKGTLEEQIIGTVAFVRRNLRVAYRIEKAGPREEIPEIPEAVYREAILNALTHRDYFADTTHPYVHIHPGRLDISNPGGLPPGLSIEELGTRAVARNRIIADMFYRLGYVERLGSGIYRMRMNMAEAYLPPPLFSINPNAFRVELFSSFSAAGFSTEESEICQWLSHKRWASTKEFLEALPIAKATLNRRLAKLAERGWIKIHGAGRGTFYTLNYGPGVFETKRDDKLT